MFCFLVEDAPLSHKAILLSFVLLHGFAIDPQKPDLTIESVPLGLHDLLRLLFSHLNLKDIVVPLLDVPVELDGFLHNLTEDGLLLQIAKRADDLWLRGPLYSQAIEVVAILTDNASEVVAVFFAITGLACALDELVGVESFHCSGMGLLAESVLDLLLRLSLVGTRDLLLERFWPAVLEEVRIEEG